MTTNLNAPRTFFHRFPGIKHVLIQVLFWIAANITFSLIIHLLLKSIGHSFNLPLESNLYTILGFSIPLGITYGTIFGTFDYYLDKYWFDKISVGMSIIVLALASFLLVSLVFLTVRHYLFDALIAPSILNSRQQVLTETSWKYIYTLLLVFHAAASLVISFITQINRKFSMKTLMALLFDKYRIPKEEDRIFMFMDLASSTTIAEELGHQRYSAFIRECFVDISSIMPAYDAEIYQYVGDEIVIHWESKPESTLACLQFFFACEQQFKQRTDYYIREFTRLPVFKAGVHSGKVTAVEIGTVKREIAFHGDTLNTASRIQGLCNNLGKRLLISDSILADGTLEKYFVVERVGTVTLKGKVTAIDIHSISPPTAIKQLSSF